MLESITCLIETVKKKCNPVLGNAQIDRFDDRFDHFFREPAAGQQRPLAAVQPLLSSANQ
jgi:hypothetical protein